MEATINEKVLKAIEAYLERNGFEIIDRSWEHGSEKVDFVTLDDGEMVFINTSVRDDREKGFPEEVSDREKFEKLALAYLKEHSDRTDITVRFDFVSLVILGDSRALLRHHRNALSAL
jgi:putative endonuclease